VLRALLVPVPVLTGTPLPTSAPLVLAPVPVPGELVSAGVVAPPSLTGGSERGEDGVEGEELAAAGGDVAAAGPVV